jgi:hypothetical protein
VTIVAKASKGSTGKAATKQVAYGKVRYTCSMVLHGAEAAVQALTVFVD